mmetsp:Transcript_21150/g.36310  ORF Transcript_21150/g.36310 Transcript_21150/m.36310 type:complete len:280 (+) Transcript_21150:93-932(+)|eukprot:CAMPEP_0196664168 /NCGR_PEP_ID=MMETSP1086-20130531/56032_1 /TAXON_ID=77921 /ORGANISM="Cyanoptyche  gloeocystis , Strain SAG4.97" /LENGTH=279 /DNA_ID=CAMNT_0042000345 /DNA_START=87 /DNA_END=926 /DNA_ORIENTATION=+
MASEEKRRIHVASSFGSPKGDGLVATDFSSSGFKYDSKAFPQETRLRLTSPTRKESTNQWLRISRLFVKVVEAKNLLRFSTGPRGPKRDCGYVTVTYGGHGYQTKTIKNSENPRWEATEFLFMVSDPKDTIVEVELRSQQGDAPDRIDPVLGVVNLNFSNMKRNELYRFWYAMQPPDESQRRDLNSEDIFLELLILDVPSLLEEERRAAEDAIQRVSQSFQTKDFEIEALKRQVADEQALLTARTEAQIKLQARVEELEEATHAKPHPRCCNVADCLVS